MTKPNAVVILQARRGSTRLPDKALAPIARRSILRHCLDRLRDGSPVPVVLATTARLEDDILEAEAERAGVRTFRGSTNDVLSRFAGVVRELGVDYLVRATADNPLVDGDGVARVLNAIVATGADHVVEEGLPYGCAVEAVSADALLRADRVATEPSDREHVTTLMRRDRACFNMLVLQAPADLRRPHLRLTVDTRADLEFVRDVFAELGNPTDDVPLCAIIAAADRVTRYGVDRLSAPGDSGSGRAPLVASGPALRQLQVSRAAESRPDREVMRRVLADLRSTSADPSLRDAIAAAARALTKRAA
jgi:spore coat polysaccharide biosynthesis protein SpsF